MEDATTRIVISAPGKVLVAGGYLVTDPKHTGLVYGLSARINVIIEPVGGENEFVVVCPQFIAAEWHYEYRRFEMEEAGVAVKPLPRTDGAMPPQNKFVEMAINYALTYVAQQGLGNGGTVSPIGSCRITILADNDYYSTGPGISAESASPHRGRFCSFPTTLQEAHKTGLGSSAALVTAVVGAVLCAYFPATDAELQHSMFNLTDDNHRRILHNLAQAAHVAAQGKVGSGFDIAAAVYGSCVYRRFPASLVSSLPEPGTPGFGPALKKLVDATWDMQIDKGAGQDVSAGGGTMALPTGLVLRMVDVKQGSATVGMVQGVMKWRKEDPERSTALWTRLQVANDELKRVLRLREVHEHEIRNAFAVVRSLLREMGDAAAVPIEPAQQTRLLDAVADMEVDGARVVLGGVVPGAGGFDALVLLMRDGEEARKQVDAFLDRWMRENPGTTARVLNVIGETEGVRREKSFDDYKEWF